ncbi:MAG: histidine kinase, partial [Evtepia sp.]|nr:histidine kinase [Evtepia sp.]
ISKEEQERVFERFYRVDQSHSKEIGGTGLGLSIVKHAALYHDAKIWISSSPGEGTEIRILFHKQEMQ